MSRQFARDWYFEVGELAIPDATFIHKYGRNDDIPNAPGTFEAIWNGGGPYTGFNAIAGDTLEVIGLAAADAGTKLYDSVATGGSATTLEDTGQTFISDGTVAIGDAILNDTQGAHGIITAITSETTLTVFRYDKDPHTPGAIVLMDAGDNYRIATKASTGCAVLRLEHLLDSEYVEQSPEYIITNGLTGVDTVGSDYMRCSRTRGIIGDMAADITVRAKVTPANIFCVIPAEANHTTICAYTIPATGDGHMLSFYAGLAAKANSVCNVRLRTKHVGEVFVTREEFTISGAANSYILREYKVPKNDLSPGTDITIEADSNTNGAGVAAGFDLIVSTHGD